MTLTLVSRAVFLKATIVASDDVASYVEIPLRSVKQAWPVCGDKIKLGPLAFPRLQIIRANNHDISIVILQIAAPVLLAMRSLACLGTAITNVQFTPRGWNVSLQIVLTELTLRNMRMLA